VSGPYRGPGKRETNPDEVAIESSTRGCPICDVALYTACKKGFALDGCRKCGGAWLTIEASRRVFVLGDPTPTDLARMISDTSEERRFRDGLRACPECKALLAPRTVGEDAGALVVDVCEDHGTWFDRGELVAAVAWLQGRPRDPVKASLLDLFRALFRDTAWGLFR
jgi:Zn-finger nucleic acid-binding protein